MARDLQGPDDAVRITTAAASRNADIAARQKRYVLSMGIRSVCFVTAVTISILGGPSLLVWILIAAALVLPYIAVVMANATSTRTDAFMLPDGAHQRPELLAGSPTERDT
ncbi:MAG: hypothetical protein JWO11_3321 [Nocardioides sp.]|nr:hypothetical protein [Nocardioides sp.]